MNLRFLTCCFCWLALNLAGLVSPVRAQVYKGVTLVEADLLADAAAIAPGKPFTVGLRLKMAPHWHTYWLNSGDAGLATKITWTLPEGFKAGPIQWPVPEKIVSPGDIINYGYSNEVVLLTEITPPAQLPPGEPTIKAKADWLVCAELCIPGSAELALKLPVAAGADTPIANGEIISKYRAQLPSPNGSEIGIEATRQTGKEYSFFVRMPIGDGEFDFIQFDFFPLPDDSVELGHPEILPLKSPSGHQDVAVKVPIVSDPKAAGPLRGVLAVIKGDGSRRGYSVPTGSTSQERGVSAPAASPSSSQQNGPSSGGGASLPTSSVASGAKTAGGLWHFLWFGFLGGLIINVMPCVLPVISLKIFGFIRQANEAPERVFKLGLAYAAGVFAWCLGFAALIAALKAGGREVGYGFHLQNPWFIVGLSVVVFVFALNLLGVFEFVLPGAVNSALTEASQHNEGYSGAFFQGVLATVLGSACTAPLFGAALGFAFAQSAPVVFAIFAAVAVGMSLPFVLLTAWPAWLRFLPKPGVWMERVKQATGFIMLATVLWLLFILGSLRGAEAIVWTGVLMLALGAACWVQNTFNTLSASGGARAAAISVMLALVLGGAWLSLPQIANAKLPAPRGDFQAQLAAALQQENRPVFIDFTADWCVNCKVNERVVLATEPVQRAIKDADAVFLTADWTAGDPAITAQLKKFGRAGVPLYVIYPADRARDPIVLPEILTQQLVLDGLKSAAASSRKPALASLEAARPAAAAERSGQ